MEYWYAVDFDPEEPYFITDFSGQWLYTGNPSAGDIYFEIYQEDFDQAPIYEFAIAAGDYDEYDTGFSALGYPVYQGDIPFTDNAFEVSTGEKYWFVLTMEYDQGMACLCNNHNLIGEEHWTCIVGEWYSSSDYYGHSREGCYAIYDDTTGIESTSLGQIKASSK
ncbi:MAG: hypothetical protein GY771_08505 [bacterium]|nr:hypothetical protein [bacterium]